MKQRSLVADVVWSKEEAWVTWGGGGLIPPKERQEDRGGKETAKGLSPFSKCLFHFASLFSLSMMSYKGLARPLRGVWLSGDLQQQTMAIWEREGGGLLAREAMSWLAGWL